ncbi:MAG: hypothetical protein K6G61_00525 [Solobacterium sp.]|nr:hypothetical protein [Solobacterium sp.]
MNPYDLFEAFSRLDDEYIEESNESRKKQSFRLLYALPPAAAMLAAAVILPKVMTAPQMPVSGADGAGAPAAHADETAYEDRTGTWLHVYEGPMLPISISGDPKDLTVERDITFDCSPYTDAWHSIDDIVSEWTDDGGNTSEEEIAAVRNTIENMYPEGGYSSYENALLIHDTYSVISSEDRKAQVYVPFISSYRDLEADIPVLTVNGEEIGYSLEPGRNAYQKADEDGMNIQNYTDWKSYARLIGSGAYENAAAVSDTASIPVKIYRFHDVYSDRNTGMITVDYKKNENSLVLTYGFHAFSSNADTNRYTASFAIPDDYTRKDLSEFYIITTGNGLSSYELFSDQEEGTWSCEVEEYDGELFRIIRQLAEHYLSMPSHQEYNIDPHMFAVSIYDDMTAKGVITDTAIRRYTGMLEINFEDTLSMDRIMFLRTYIDLHKNETAEFKVRYKKKGSYTIELADEWEENRPSMHCYELTPKAGTSLEFAKLSAELTNYQDINITANNFGFDTEQNITSVILDPIKEYYYLEIEKKIPEEGE